MYPRGMKLGLVATAWVAVSVVVGLLVTGACDLSGEGDLCDRPDVGHHGPNGQLDQCHCQDPPSSASALAVGARDPWGCCACPSTVSGMCSLTDATCYCPFNDTVKDNVCPDAGSGCASNDPACWADAGDAGDAEGPTGSCAGECLPSAPAFWTDPLLIWFGAEADAPGCPDVAPAVGYEGHADLTAPAATCGACSCGAPAGSCELPAALTANAASCPGTAPGTAHTPFDPASGWTGACDANEPIPSGKLCSGTKCVQSVTIAPLTITESCAPSEQPVPQDLPSTWATFARACTPRVCVSPGGEVCVPVASLPSGFRACVGHEGDVECPAFGPYQDRHVVYGGVDDTRSCTPCACGAPVGSTCEALISMFGDGACSSLVDTATVTALGTICHDVPAGSALGSKSAGVVTYSPGACQASGGEPMGDAEPSEPVTFCCMPAPFVG